MHNTESKHFSFNHTQFPSCVSEYVKLQSLWCFWTVSTIWTVVLRVTVGTLEGFGGSWKHECLSTSLRLHVCLLYFLTSEVPPHLPGFPTSTVISTCVDVWNNVYVETLFIIMLSIKFLFTSKLCENSRDRNQSRFLTW